MYVIPSDNIIPVDPNQKAIIDTNFESPFPIASFLKKNFAETLNNSNNKKEIRLVNVQFINKSSCLKLLKIWINNKFKKPIKKPIFMKTWGIQKYFISIKPITKRSEIKNQPNIVSGKLWYIES